MACGVAPWNVNMMRACGNSRCIEALLLAAVFAVAHTQSPLYFSNQNQYLLHGAALGGHGGLERDWLANTLDPTPIFSVLVAAAYRINVWLLQPAYFLLLMTYFLSARWLTAAVPGFPDTRSARIAFAALFTAAHAAILRWASVQLTGVDYPWYFQAGLASQYLLGPGIQPSAFGVLLLTSVAAFAHSKPATASLLAAAACTMHFTYFLPAALLVLGYVVALGRGGDIKQAVRCGLVALIAAAPALAYLLGQFEPFDPSNDESMRILARVRIPHHTLPSRWFDLVAALQVVWILSGLASIRGTAFGKALVVAAIGGTALTALQLAANSDRLALAFPWRISVLLVPIATCVLIGKVLARMQPGRRSELLSLTGLFVFLVGGMIVTGAGLGYRMLEAEEGLYDYIRSNSQQEDVYLLPVELPAVGRGRGAVSNTFAPPPLAKQGTNQIPVDLQRFRLSTGACIYVDFKSVPYSAAEVEEWYRRMQFASGLVRHDNWESPETYAALKREGITHVVRPRHDLLEYDYLTRTYEDSVYIVYRVK